MSTLAKSIPRMDRHSAGIGTTAPDRRVSAALRRSPLVQVKNLPDITTTTSQNEQNREDRKRMVEQKRKSEGHKQWQRILELLAYYT